MISQITEILFCHFTDCADNVELKCRAFQFDGCPMHSGIKISGTKRNPNSNGSLALSEDNKSHFMPAFQIWARPTSKPSAFAG
jgi:hypothetical protein